MSMKIILNSSLDPYFNLAAEEYLLENESEDVFMLWRNPASVIIGKNQNAWAEVDTAFTESRGIAVVRRLTGGGAVFHDEGNVNFTFIKNAPENPSIDFSPFVEPIIKALDALGISAAADGRNDILADGCKISGNAQCIYRRKDGTKRLMHHGTLLYNADLSVLAGALRVNRDKLRSKGIKSVSSRVNNIQSIGGLDMTASEFVDYLTGFACELYGGDAVALTDKEKDGIAALARDKYSTWEWNFGKSPEYESSVSGRFPWGGITACFTVDKGVIKFVSVTGDFFGTEAVSELEAAITGCPFERGAVTARLSALSVGSYISGASAKDITDLLFGED